MREPELPDQIITCQICGDGPAELVLTRECTHCSVSYVSNDISLVNRGLALHRKGFLHRSVIEEMQYRDSVRWSYLEKVLATRGIKIQDIVKEIDQLRELDAQGYPESARVVE